LFTNKKKFLLVIVLLLVTFRVSAQPNVVAILVDDLSVDALQTLLDADLMPNLSSGLIDEGVDFNDAFATNPLCCPSRATFLTGLYTHNHKVYANLNGAIKPGITWPAWFGTVSEPGLEASTIATWLQSAGHHTGFIGKYLNGYGENAPEGIDPNTYVPPGWDYWFGLIDPTTYRMYDYSANDNGVVVQYGNSPDDYQTDVLSNQAVSYLQQRSPGQPFYLQINTLAPHVESFFTEPAGPVPDYRNRFSSIVRPAIRHLYLLDSNLGNGEIPGLPSKPSFNEADVSDKPACSEAPPPPLGTYVIDDEPSCVGNLLPLRTDIDVPNVQRQFKHMLASMLAVDDLIGAVVAALQANNLLDTTTLIFTSDNGYFYGEHRLSDKLMAYEESIRIPLYIRAPGYAANTTASQIVLNNDMAPTIAALANVSAPNDLDGTSLLPLLTVPTREDWFRKSFLVEHWFIPSIRPYQMATSMSLRSIDPGIRDFLYTQTYANYGVAEITHREFYNLLADPYQTESIDLLSAATDLLDLHTQLLLGCRGNFCRLLESF